jgi:hypothetical protein
VPAGEHLAYCLECGKRWIVGDYIPSVCPECECKRDGHRLVQDLDICLRCGIRVIRPVPAEGVSMPQANAQQAQQQAEQSVDQLAQAHGLFGGGWGAVLLPILIQLIQAVQQKMSGGANAGQTQPAPSGAQRSAAQQP